MKSRLFALNSAKALGKSISKTTGMALGAITSQKFADGEVYVRFDESVRGKRVFLVAQAQMPYENLFEVLLAIDAAKRAWAREVIAIIPFLPHSRQERKDRERSSIAARLLADTFTNAGVDRIMTFDLHTTAIEGFYKIPIDHLETYSLFESEIKRMNLDKLCLCSPDFGGVKRIKFYAKKFESDIAVINKERLKHNQVASMQIIGEVKDRNVILIDDMIDTGGTLCKAAELIMEKGALSVRAICTHAVMSGNAEQRINDSVLDELIIADTINKKFDSPKIKTVSTAKMVGKAIFRLTDAGS